MKIALKIILAAMVAIVALALVAVLIFTYSPGLQRSTLLKYANKQPGLSVEVDRFQMRFTKAEILGLRVQIGGTTLQMESLQSHYSAWGLIRSHLRVSSLKVKGLVVDLPAETPPLAGDGGLPVEVPAQGSESDATEPMRGLLAALNQTGITVDLDAVEVDGRIQHPDIRQGDFSLRINGMKSGASGSAELDVAVMPADAEAPFNAATMNTLLTIGQDSEGKFNHLLAESNFKVREAARSEWIEALLTVDVSPSPSGESYAISLHRVGIDAPLLQIDASWQPDAQRVEGTGTINITDQAVSGLSAIGNLPLLTANGSTLFSYSTIEESARFDLNLTTTGRNLGQDALTGFEPFRSDIKATLSYAASSLRVDELQLNLFQQDSQELAVVSLQKPVALDFMAKDFGLNALEGELVKLRLGRLPLALLEKFMPGLRVGGNSLPGEGSLSSRQGKIYFTTTVPIGIENVTLTGPDGVRQGPVALRLRPYVEYTPEGGRLNLRSSVQLFGPFSNSAGSLSASVEPADTGRYRIDANISLDSFSLDEWTPFISAFPKAESPTTDPDAAPDSEPAWAMLEGKLTARLNRLIASGNAFTAIKAEVLIENGRRIEAQVTGMNASSPLRLDAEVEFLESRPERPYALSANVDVRGFNVTPFLKPADASKPGILEGAFNVVGSLKSEAPNLAYIADRAIGSFDLTSDGKGFFRPLGERTSLATGISGILGSLTGNVRELRWVQEVINQLKEIPFSQMTFRVDRGSDLNLSLREFDVVSRETRIRGEGKIQYTEGISPLKFPMDLKFQLFAKGRLAEALRDGKQLESETPDSLGFLPGPPLPLRGSLANPESLLINVLMDSGSKLVPGLF